MNKNHTNSLPFDKNIFFHKFLQSPKQVGSIIPSSRFLTQKMMNPIPWDQVKSVAELGAGTGVFTHSIQQLKHPDCQVFVFEQDAEMRKQLAFLFPSLHLRNDAQNLTRSMQELGVSKLDCIVSGLPFANFSQDKRECIINEVLSALRPGGLFITFQYSLQMRKMLNQQFTSVNTTFVPLNFPPAFVYVCRK